MFSADKKSINDRFIPLDYDTKEPHQCPSSSSPAAPPPSPPSPTSS
jgi:hypothetical protein